MKRQIRLSIRACWLDSSLRLMRANIQVKLPRKCHGDEAQLFGSTKEEKLTHVCRMDSSTWFFGPVHFRFKGFLVSFYYYHVFSSPEHEVLMVSYCGQSMSIVRRASSVVRRAASTIALKAYSSYTLGQLTRYLVGSIRVTCRSKIAKIVPIGNPRWLPWPPSWKSIFRFFSWTERPIASKLARKHRGDL